MCKDAPVVTAGISSQCYRLVSLPGLRNKAVSSLQALLISHQYNVQRLMGGYDVPGVLPISESQTLVYYSEP